nr:hypothetical protein [Tanacetum cinerariifolium]
MVFMAQIEKVLSDLDESSSSAEETIAEVAYYTSESESESEFETSEYYDNSTNYGLFVNNDDDQEIFHDAIKSASENFIENHIDSQKDYDKSEVDHNDSEEKEHEQNNDFNDQIRVLNEKNVDLLDQTKVLKDKLQVKHVVIDTHVECHKKYAKLEEEKYEYMIRYSALFDNDKQHRKQIADQEVLFDKMSVQLVELDKHVRDLKNAILEKDFKISELEECVRNKYLEIEKCLKRLNVCENKIHKMGQTNQTVHMIMPSKDIMYNGRKRIGFENPRYFEKSKDLRPSLYDEKQTSLLKPFVPNVILEKIIIDLEDEVVSLLEKEKENLKTIKSLKSNGFESSENAISKSENQCENDCLEVEKECDKVENPKVIALGMFKLSVSQSISQISMSKMSCESNNVERKLKRKRRKRKSSKQNDKQVNNDVLHANRDFVHFSDLDTFSSVRRPKHSGVIWKKKESSNTSNVDLSAVSLSKLNKNVKRYSRKDLLSCNNSHLRETSSAYVCNDAMNVSCNSRMCDLLDDNNFFIFDDESVKISPVSKMPFWKKPHDSMHVCSKSNMIKSLPRTVHKWLPKLQPLAEPIAKRFHRHMTGNRALLTNFVEKFLGTVRFGNNDIALIAGYGNVVIGSMTIKKVYYVEDGVDFLTDDRSLNLYNIALNEVASNSSTCLLAKRVRTDNGTKFKNKNLAKFFDEVERSRKRGDIRVFVGYSKESVAFRIYNKRTRKIHESVNVNFNEISEMASKQFSLEPDLSNLNEREKISNPSVSKVSEASKKDLEDLFQDFYDEYFDSSKIMKSSTTNVDTLINEEVFHESISINMIPNGHKASTSHNVFNERLEDTYFDASTSFHDPSNVHTYYQPYPHEKKWTKDHPLHKIIGDPKSSVRTRGQLANSCLFSCLLGSIKPANVAEALRDADWVSAMKEELDQFARSKV